MKPGRSRIPLVSLILTIIVSASAFGHAGDDSGLHHLTPFHALVPVILGVAVLFLVRELRSRRR